MGEDFLNRGVDDAHSLVDLRAVDAERGREADDVVVGGLGKQTRWMGNTAVQLKFIMCPPRERLDLAKSKHRLKKCFHGY